MNQILLILVFIFSLTFAQAQEAYFQQEVNYKINVKLDDKAHTLSGEIDITYTNRASYALKSIYFHLWPNAYSNRQTAFAKQQIQHNHTDFHFAKDADLGHITDLQFTVENQPLEMTIPNKDNPDIAIVKLNKPLPQGGTITLSTPFTVKIPASFSRLGHVKTSYQISQWYPKPAVLDQYGWHPMPYLSSGEFYSEFGSFDVSITLPKNYVVGATGSLQTASEIQFLHQKVKETEARRRNEPVQLKENFPVSDREQKTIRYIAEQVHDFAWFADKRFNVLQDEVILPAGKKIQTWAMFPDEGWESWQKATDYLNRSIQHYSTLVGPYPYPHATAVMSALSAGAGMEYPMITVIGNQTGRDLDNVITHEVGHNWFYGILASNERDFPWMDEGLNTYYDTRYMNKYYKPERLDQQRLLYITLARFHKDVSPNYPVTKMSEANYGLTAYAKPSISLQMLEDFVGTELFDKTMKSYYETWKFKHPNPIDFHEIWQKATPKNLDWFFNSIINTTKKMDYKLLKVNKLQNSTQIKVKNKGDLQAPFFIAGIIADQIMDSLVVDGFQGIKTFNLPGNNYDAISIDPRNRTLDLYPNNNSSVSADFRLKLGFGINIKKKFLYYLPVYGWNKYDKSMLGLQFFNDGFLNQKLYFELAPMYSFGGKTLVGKGLIEYPIYVKKFFQKIVPSLSFRRFSYFTNTTADYTQHYNRIAPKIEIHLLPKLNTTRYFTIQHEIIQTAVPLFSNTGEFKYLEKQLNQYNQVSFYTNKKNAIRSSTYFIGLEQAQYDNFDLPSKQFLKAKGSASFVYKYQKRSRVALGFKGAYFLQNDARYSTSFNNGLVLGSLSATGIGRDDYAFRNLYLGRNENDHFLGQQILPGDGGLKVPSLNGPIGHSNDWMFGLNMLADAPIKLPRFIKLSPYFDVLIYAAPKDHESTTMKTHYSGGIQLNLKVLKINFPIFNDKELDLHLKQLNNGNYLGRISYSLNLKLLSPKNIQQATLNSFL